MSVNDKLKLFRKYKLIGNLNEDFKRSYPRFYFTGSEHVLAMEDRSDVVYLLRFDSDKRTCEVIQQETLPTPFERILFDQSDGNRFAFLQRDYGEDRSSLLVGKFENGRMLIDKTPIVLNKALLLLKLIGQKRFGFDSGFLMDSVSTSWILNN
jgi:hypothetical protein